MKIAGYKKVSFTTDDNVKISGYKVYFFGDFSKQINKEIRGCYFESAFLSDIKFHEMNVHEAFESQTEVTILYNRYGKFERFI